MLLDDIATGDDYSLWPLRHLAARGAVAAGPASSSELLGHTLDNDIATIAGPAFMMLARATVDASAIPGEDATPQLRTLRDPARTDPLGPGSMPASRQACAAQWDATTARAAGRDSVEISVRAVAEWETLVRPHDAAYCRWRAAQAVLRDGGQHALVARLLTRAASDAREHAPLSAAIAGTSAHSAHPTPAEQVTAAMLGCTD